MRRTVAELRAELLKAGRGAGLPLGTAEDLAWAAEWIRAEALKQILDGLRTGEGRKELTAMANALDARALGAEPKLSGPLWQALVAFQDQIAPPTEALEISDAQWRALAGHAAQTYVPETDQSRLRGAGAGDIDND